MRTRLERPLASVTGTEVLAVLSALAELPHAGMLAAQSVTTAIEHLVRGEALLVKDLDVFVLTGDRESLDPAMREVWYSALRAKLASDYCGGEHIKLDREYTVLRSDVRGLINTIFIAGAKDYQHIIGDFDLNCVQVGVDLATGELIYTHAFDTWFDGREPMRVMNVSTPQRTLIRLANKHRDRGYAVDFDDQAKLLCSVIAVALSQLQRDPDRSFSITEAKLREYEQVQDLLSSFVAVDPVRGPGIALWRLIPHPDRVTHLPDTFFEALSCGLGAALKSDDESLRQLVLAFDGQDHCLLSARVRNGGFPASETIEFVSQVKSHCSRHGVAYLPEMLYDLPARQLHDLLARIEAMEVDRPGIAYHALVHWGYLNVFKAYRPDLIANLCDLYDAKFDEPGVYQRFSAGAHHCSLIRTGADFIKHWPRETMDLILGTRQSFCANSWVPYTHTQDGEAVRLHIVDLGTGCGPLQISAIDSDEVQQISAEIAERVLIARAGGELDHP